MFLGHIGVGFGAKSITPRVSLGTLLLASLFIDLLWPTLLMLGFEHCEISPGDTKLTPISFTDYPFSHSLLAVLLWAFLFAGINYLIRRSSKEAWVCGIIVFSHWVLDLFVHRPDLQLMPGLPVRVGFGLWNSLPATLAVELSIFIIGIVLYCYNTRALDRVGYFGFWGMIVFLVIMYLGNIFGPPPPSVRAVAWSGQAQWLLVIWGFWIEKHRTLRWLYN
ncbi:MAG: hypothetical protein ABIJ42_11865 [Acidobacteriota bacterium]